MLLSPTLTKKEMEDERVFGVMAHWKNSYVCVDVTHENNCKPALTLCVCVLSFIQKGALEIKCVNLSRFFYSC